MPMLNFSSSSLSSGWRSLLLLLCFYPWQMGAGCSGFGEGTLSNKLEDPPNQGGCGGVCDFSASSRSHRRGGIWWREMAGS
jgi:hypothetical protein